MDIEKDLLSEHYLVGLVSEFSQFLEDDGKEMEEILRHLNRKTFVGFGSQTIRFTFLNSKNELNSNLISGTDILEKLNKSGLHNLNNKIPTTDVFRSGKILWITTLPYWGEDYPLLNDYPVDSSYKTSIAIPIFMGETVKGVLAMLCTRNLSENSVFNDFFTSIAGLLSIHLLNSPELSES